MKTLERHLNEYGRYRSANQRSIGTAELTEPAEFVSIVSRRREGLWIGLVAAAAVVLVSASVFVLARFDVGLPATEPSLVPTPTTVVDTAPTTVVDTAPTTFVTPSTTVTPLTPELVEWFPAFGKVVKVWPNHFTGHAGSTDQLDWYEPEGVISRTLYVTVCTPQCDEEPSKADMSDHRIAYGPEDTPSMMVGTLYRYPELSPSEVWWSVELKFDPRRSECQPILNVDGECVVDSGPFQIEILPRDASND